MPTSCSRPPAEGQHVGGPGPADQPHHSRRPCSLLRMDEQGRCPSSLKPASTVSAAGPARPSARAPPSSGTPSRSAIMQAITLTSSLGGHGDQHVGLPGRRLRLQHPRSTCRCPGPSARPAAVAHLLQHGPGRRRSTTTTSCCSMRKQSGPRRTRLHPLRQRQPSSCLWWMSPGHHRLCAACTRRRRRRGRPPTGQEKIRPDAR
ncbi:MAG: hypothetical protein KatS3mg044_1034 [Rhodothermaceae bacterium]|nr:MAG: hypothetical protein KatS3mg044_1034 [Rhodothermaceae bacterium]